VTATAVLERVRAQAARCPTDPTTASYHHAAARADAATGAPVTEAGRNLVATARPWGDGRVIGDCVCGSSFIYRPAPPAAGE
jgi:hypothetical protein